MTRGSTRPPVLLLTAFVMLGGVGRVPTVAAQTAPAGPPFLAYGGDSHRPPFEYLDSSGRPRGFNVDLIRAVAREAGIRIDIRLAPWKVTLANFEAGKVDLISLAYTDERAKKYSMFFQTRTLTPSLVFIGTRDSFPRRLDMLRREIVAVEDQSAVHDFLLAISPSARPLIRTAPDPSAVMRMLADGKATVAAGDGLTLRFAAEELSLGPVATIPVTSLPYHLAVRKDRQSIESLLLPALLQLRATGEIDRLITESSLIPGRTRGWRDYVRVLAGGAAFVLALVIGFVLWNRSLREKVDARTKALTASLQQLERSALERSRVEDALRDSEDRFQAFMNHSPAIAFMKDEEGRYVYINKPLERRFGTTLEELRGRTAFEWLPADTATALSTNDAMVLSEGPAEFVEPITMPDGVPHSWLTFRFPFVDGSGKKFLGGVAIDITRRNLAEEKLRASEARIRSILDNMLEALMTVDESGVIDSMNASAEKMFGYRSEQLVGRHLRTLLPEAAGADPEQFLKSAYKRAIGRITEWEGRRQNGEVFPFELSLFEFGVPGGRHLAGSMRDVSERREVDRMKNEFVSIVSHELRTPLTSIRGSLQLVLDDEHAVEGSEYRELLSVSLANCERLIRIISDILDISKIEAGRFTLDRRPTRVRDVVRLSIQNVESIATAASVRLVQHVPDALPRILVDTDRMVQAIVNLLGNALKFAPPKSIVHITADQRPDGGVGLSVRDHGKGIAPEDLGRLFQKFQQLDGSASRSVGGTGLGLAITKALVEQHGGTVSVVSVVDKGTTFTIALPSTSVEAACPLTESHHVDSVSASRRSGADQKADPDVAATILLAEADEDLRGVLAHALGRRGFIVLTARDGRETLDVFEEAHVDLVVLNLVMAGLDGFEVIARLRASARGAEVPVVAISDSDASDSAARAFKIGADAVLFKPLNANSLLLEVRRSLRQIGQTTSRRFG